MTRFLIVGGAGYIGSHVSKELAEQSCEVVVLDNVVSTPAAVTYETAKQTFRRMKAAGMTRPTVYFFGALTRRDLFLVEELSALADELPWFTFVPALSQHTPGDPWTGATGLITEVVAAAVDEKKIPGIFSDPEAYLCG